MLKVNKVLGQLEIREGMVDEGMFKSKIQPQLENNIDRLRLKAVAVGETDPVRRLGLLEKNDPKLRFMFISAFPDHRASSGQN